MNISPSIPKSAAERLGSAYLAVVGLLGLIIIVVFFFSFSTRSRISIVSLYDLNKTARYFLESYAGDVISQLEIKANDKDSELYELFRQAVNLSGAQTVNTAFYNKSELVKFLESNLPQSAVVKAPKISFDATRQLYLPQMFDISDYESSEYEANLTIVCGLELEGRSYELKLEYPFKAVALLLPFVREFVFFADQLHLEQRTPYPPQDRINLVEIKDSSGGHSGSGWPIIIGPSIEGGDADAHGKVFLGADNRPIYLNFAGEKNYRGIRPDGSFDGGLMGDLWQVSSAYLGPANPDNDPFTNQAVFQKTDGSWFSLRSVHTSIDMVSVVSMGILGFSDENTNNSDGHFVNVVDRLKFHRMFAGDPSFERYEQVANNNVFSMAAPIKLLGVNREFELPSSQRYRGPNRQIFGDVFGRFFQVSFFSTSADSTSAGNGILTYGASSPISYFSPLPGTNYEHFMTRVISGGEGYDPDQVIPSDYYPINRNESLASELLKPRDYSGSDGLKVRGNFTDYASQWLKLNVSPSERVFNSKNSVWERVSREFSSQVEFKKYAGYSQNRFWVEGVCYVRGDLDLSEGIRSDDIRGGIILVEGNITLGDIDRGIDFNDDEALNQNIDEMPADKVLTFVSLGSGSQIRIVGGSYMGIQLVKLRPSMTAPEEQIVWSQSVENRQFFGSIVVSTPNFVQWTRSFNRDAPYLHYIPSMAGSDMPVSVQVGLRPANYSLSVAASD